MKIAFLSFYSGHIDRGVEVASAALVKGLSKKHTVHLYQVGERIDTTIDTRIIPVHVNFKSQDKSGTWSRKFYLDYWSRKIAQFTMKFIPFLFKEKYDVVIPTNGGWQVLLVRLFTWILRKKMVVQGNAGIGYDDFFQIVCLPDHYIAISPNGFRWATKFLPWVKKSYIPYGVDLELFQSATSVTVSLKKPIVLCVAAFSPYKQVELLVRAMEKVENASLLVIGQGPLEKELRELGEKLLGTRFLLKTGVTHDKLIGYYKSSDVFSLPSEPSEAFGIVYIEAMAAGLTNVAPDDWRKEIIGQAGYYVDPTNTDAFANTINTALKNPLKDRALTQAKRYRWNHIVEEYENLLQSL